MNRIIGEKNRFAIEYSFLGVEGNLMYGHLCYWICNMQIGDFSEVICLSDCLESITWMVKDNGKREHKELFYSINSSEIIFDALGSVDSIYNSKAMEEQWAKFSIIGLIDGWRVYLIEYKKKARFIIVDYRPFVEGIGDCVLTEVYLEAGLFDEAITILYHDFFSMYDQYSDQS